MAVAVTEATEAAAVQEHQRLLFTSSQRIKLIAKKSLLLPDDTDMEAVAAKVEKVGMGASLCITEVITWRFKQT